MTIQMISDLRGMLYSAKFALEQNDPQETKELIVEIDTMLDKTAFPPNVHPREFTAAVFAMNASEVLLVHHKKLQLWLPVGGKREGYEMPIETAKRELFEETGLRASFPKLPDADVTTTPLGFLGYREHTVDHGDIHMNFDFLGLVTHRVVQGDGSFDDVMWVDPAQGYVWDKKKKTTPSVLAMLQKIHGFGL